jgi:hypothetical protein
LKLDQFRAGSVQATSDLAKANVVFSVRRRTLRLGEIDLAQRDRLDEILQAAS